MDNHTLALEIIKACGGQKNITQSWHCITRLRFNVADEKKVDVKKIRSLKGVLGAQFQSGQFQVIIGNNVAKVYDEVKAELGDQQEADQPQKKRNVIDVIFDTISGIFTPILPAIVGAGLLKGILALLVTFHWITDTSGEYMVLNLISDAPFYFLPFLVAVSSARKFKTNEFLSLTLAASLLYPTIVDAVNTGAFSSIGFLGLSIPMVNYSSSVIPAILGVWLLSYIHRFIDRVIPNLLKIILTPLLVLMITIPIVLIFIAPRGNYTGVFIEQIFSWLFANTGPFAGIVLGGTMSLIVITGMHYAFFPGTFQSFSKVGYDIVLLPISLVSNLAQAGATIGVAIKSKDRNLRSLAYSTGLSAIFGITEPAIYGVTLKLKKPFYAALIGGAVGGGFITTVGLKTFGFAVPGIVALPLYVDSAGTSNFIYALIGIVLSFGVAFICSILFGFEDGTTVKSEESKENPQPAMSSNQTKQMDVLSPITGSVRSLAAVPDKTFADELIGKGIAVMPENNLVKAPFKGVVSMVTPTHHAIGLKSEDGVEMLIHVGLDTVSLNGKHFELLVNEGDSINIGDELLRFDLQAIKAENIDLITPIVITNSQEFLDVIATSDKEVVAGNSLLLMVLR